MNWDITRQSWLVRGTFKNILIERPIKPITRFYSAQTGERAVIQLGFRSSDSIPLSHHWTQITE